MSLKVIKKYSVLIADDSEEDSFFMERALRESTRFQVVGSVRDGEEAVAYLGGTGTYSDRQLWPFPDLVLIDLKMPRLDGFQVLEWLQKQNFSSLKAVVLSGASIAGDIQRVRSLGADAFYAKTLQHARLIELVKNLEAFLLDPTSVGAIPPSSK
ncbi:response regulator [Pedosphaera parvula]|nr:response regulator [Pedosphaera parvula]